MMMTKLTVNRRFWARALKGWTTFSLISPSPATWITTDSTISGKHHIQSRNQRVTGSLSAA